MSWRLRWLVVAPIVLFVALTLMMSSCGGSSGCEGSFDEFGNFLPGVCPTPGPNIGFQLGMIVIGNGTPIPETPTPSPTPSAHKTMRATPTATNTLVPQASPTAVEVGGQVAFNASGCSFAASWAKGTSSKTLPIAARPCGPRAIPASSNRRDRRRWVASTAASQWVAHASTPAPAAYPRSRSSSQSPIRWRRRHRARYVQPRSRLRPLLQRREVRLRA